MSYDLRIWGRHTQELAECLPTRHAWIEQRGGWRLGKRNWQIVVEDPKAVEPEDVPPEAAQALPGLSVLVELSLEPGDAPKTAHATLRTVARAIARAFAGLIEDPQEDSITLPRGIKRFARPKREERFSIVDLSWWFMGSPLRATEGAATLLRILTDTLPEAVPRRYGLWEPPQFKTEETGTEALAVFLRENLDDMGIYYPTRPVVGFSVSDSQERLSPKLKSVFRSNHLSIELEFAALRQPGWERSAKQLWRSVSRFLQPFYGDVRVLSGFSWLGGTTGSDRTTERHPVRSHFWRGIPPSPGLAIVLGPPYTALWQPAGSTRDGELTFIEHPQWSRGEPLDLDVPTGLAQRRESPPWYVPNDEDQERWWYEFPSIWPFAHDTTRR